MIKKILSSFLLVMVLGTTSYTAYAAEEIECSTDPAFAQNSCSQCFTGWEKKSGDHIGFLSDEWINENTTDQILYKEEQSFPEMVDLAGADVIWSQTPDSEGFWEYPAEFNALYSEDQEGYVLPAGESITWLQSKLAYAYKLDSNTAPEGDNIGMLVYPIAVHNIGVDGDIELDAVEHNECVLFTSGEGWVSEPTPERLPDTGPKEFMLLFIIAMILGFVFLQFKKRA